MLEVIVKVQETNLKGLMELFSQWWPVAALLLVVYFGLRYIRSARFGASKALDVGSLAIHEIRTALACTDQQAKKLLQVYGGNSSKAIHEVKTGKAVLPGLEVSDLALYGGEAKRFVLSEADLLLITQDGRDEILSTKSRALLTIGVVDESQRPNPTGLGRADRGQAFAHLFWERDGEWVRFLLNSRRMDYVALGERKENSAVRNFRIVLGDLLQHSPEIKTNDSLLTLQSDLKAPLHKTLAGFEAQSTQILRQWKENRS